MRARLVKELSPAGKRVYVGYGDGKRWQVRIYVPAFVKNDDLKPEIDVTFDPFRDDSEQAVSGTTTPTAPVQTEGSNKKKGCFGCLGIAVGVVILLAVIGRFLPKPSGATSRTISAQQSSEPTEDEKIRKARRDLHLDHLDTKGQKIIWTTSAELLKTYEGNELFADGIFRDHIFAVKGRIQKIGKDLTGNLYLTLAGAPSDFRSVQAFFDSSYETDLELKAPGQTVTVAGMGAGLTGNALLKQCWFPLPDGMGKRWNSR